MDYADRHQLRRLAEPTDRHPLAEMFKIFLCLVNGNLQLRPERAGHQANDADAFCTPAELLPHEFPAEILVRDVIRQSHPISPFRTHEHNHLLSTLSTMG